MANNDSFNVHCELLNRIACDAQAIVRLVGHAQDGNCGLPQLDGIRALASGIGALADATQATSGQAPPIDSLHGWLLARA